ncbi:MAG: cellulase family glycosylhydrolase [Deltaproteobacteria bacterium]|nr:cellulase family glycosylhydrolase [Deltaproteobacteria bacterium]
MLTPRMKFPWRSIEIAQPLPEEPTPPDETPPPGETPPPPEETPPPLPDSVGRPASSLGLGFFVRDGQIFDSNGVAFVMRGMNHSHAWGEQDSALAAVDAFPNTGANAVRTAFMPGLGADTPAERRTVVERYLENGIVPIVEDHRTTCSDDPATLRAAVDEWLLPENIAWLTQYEDRVILNIANEWLNTTYDDELWVSEYAAAITRLRAAGLHHLIVVDAGGSCGQNPRSIRDAGQRIVDADPEHNVAFSLHMYAYWRTAGASDVGAWNDHGLGSPWLVAPEVEAIRARGLALIVGEVGFDSFPSVGYSTKALLQDLLAVDVGFLAWSWNANSDPRLDMSSENYGARFDSESDLSDGGRLFVLDPEVGLQATAQGATIW